MKILASKYCSCITDDNMVIIKRQLRKNNNNQALELRTIGSQKPAKTRSRD